MCNIEKFLKENGVSLADCGSAEYGLEQIKALVFLDLLFSNGKYPLGLEVWRWSRGKYVIESLGGWYSEGTNLEINVNSAKEFLLATNLSKKDLVTIQFL